MTSSDAYDFAMSQMSQGGDEQPFSRKEYIEVLDSNNGFYNSNTVKFNLSSLYNQSAFLQMSEMVLDIPIVMVVSHVAGADAAFSPMMATLKNGAYNLIDSMRITYDGKEVTQHTSHQQFYTNFKMHTSLNLTESEVLAQQLFYSKDTATSWSHINELVTGAAVTLGYGTEGGLGLVNCVPIAGNGYTEDRVNKGMAKRCSYVHNPDQYNTLVNEQNGFITNSKSYTKKVDVGGNVLDYQVWYINALIRLKDVSSFCEHLPLLKNGLMTLDINLNLGSLFFSSAAADNTAQVFNHAQGVRICCPQAQTQFPNRVCPFMIAAPNSAANTECAGAQSHVVAGIYVAKVTSSIGGTAVNQSMLNVAPHTRQSCRILCPTVELQPHLALKYLEENRQKTVEYLDWTYTELDLAAGSSLTKTLSESTVNPVGLLIVPMLSEQSNSGIDPLSSPFTCEPATTAPIGLSQFNVLLNGRSIYPSAIQYDYASFLQEMDGVNSINGGATLGMSSGLIGLTDYQSIYKYMYVNLERRVIDAIQPKGVSIIGFNNNYKALKLHCFVITRKSVVIDIESGKLVAMSNTAV